MRMQTFAVVVALTAYSGACSYTLNSTSTPTPEVSTLVVLNPVTASINEQLRIPIESSQWTIDEATVFSGAQFVNATKGWVFGQRSLFVTSDSVKSWKRLPLDVPTDSRLSAIFFIDESRGWLARNTRLTMEPYGPGNSAKILATFDGGASWIDQATFPDGVQINRVKFLNADLGLAVGSRIKNHRPPYDEFFLAKTIDGGKSWTDISYKAKPAIDNGAGLTPGKGSDLHWFSPSNIVLLMSEGRLVVTSDGGENWKTVAKFKDQRPDGTVSSVSYHRLLIDTQQRIRIIAGAMGDEGYWGDLVVQGDQKTWSTYELRGIPIFDALFLSQDEIVACGMLFGRNEDNQSQPPVGVILYSSDTGKNWTPIYRSQGKDAFISLSKVGSNQFFAVSETGTVLQFALDKNTTDQVRSR